MNKDFGYSWSLETDQVERYAFWDSLFSPLECEAIVSICKEYNLKSGSIISKTNSNDESIRKSEVAFIQPTPEMRWVYERLTSAVNDLNSKYFNFDLWGFGEGLQFTEYVAPAGHYDSHVDKFYGGVIRKLSIVLQLTDDTTYTGGDFEIVDNTIPEKLSRKQGTLLVFPSFTLHRVTPVTEGTRNSLVGWITGKPFK